MRSADHLRFGEVLDQVQGNHYLNLPSRKVRSELPDVELTVFGVNSAARLSSIEG